MDETPTQMSKALCILIPLSTLLLSQEVMGQQIFTVDAAYKADVEVYVVDAAYKADLVVYRVDAGYKAKDNRGLWYFTDAAYKADKLIFFTDAAYKAELLIYFTDAAYKAEWKRTEKQQVMF